MPCFFCESVNHLSQFCNIYKTDDARKKVLIAKKCCSKCLGITDNYDVDAELCGYCKIHRKCYNCFSRSHYTKDCSALVTNMQVDQFPVFPLFLPNIDTDLISRFLEFLAIEEKCFIFFKYPESLNMAQPKPFKVAYLKEITLPTTQTFSTSDFVVVEKAYFKNEFNKNINPNNFLIHENFQIHNLVLWNSTLSADEFFKLLCFKTRTLKCANVKFSPKLTFCSILRKAPLLQELDIHPTNVKVTNNWLDDLLSFNQAKNLKYFRLVIPDFYFNVEVLANLIKEKHAKFFLLINWPSNKEFVKETAFTGVTNKLSSHFIPEKSSTDLKISFFYKSEDGYCFKIENYKLKNL